MKISTSFVRKVIAVGLGFLFGLFFLWASALWLKLIFLFIALLLLIFVGLSILAPTRWVPVSIPGYLHESLSYNLSALSCGIYYLVVGQSFIWQLLCALGMLVLLVKGGRAVMFSFLSTVGLRRLQSDFRQGVYPRHAPPHVLIIGTPMSGLRHLRRLIYQVTQNLWKFRAQSPESLVSPYVKAEFENTFDRIDEKTDFIFEETDKGKVGKFLGVIKVFVKESSGLLRRNIIEELLYKRSLVFFITSSELSRHTPAFQEYVAENAASIVAAPSFLSRFQYGEDDEPEDEAVKAKRFSEETDEKLPSFLAGWMREEIQKTQSHESNLSRQIHCSQGPAFIFVAAGADEKWKRFEESSAEKEYEQGYGGKRGYETILVNRKPGRTSGTPVAHIVDVLDNVTIPIARSDARLSPRLREGISAIGTQGLAPLADCYLRFRLAESDVERFLGLIDCFETLIKYSLLTLVSVEEQEPHDMSRRSIFGALERPSMGTWIHLLREAKKNVAQERTGLSSSIDDAWDQSLEGAPRNLISTANGAGLAWPGKVPRTHMVWLQWLSWLRNKTKGHGGVEESTCSAVWHDFHETFLEIALDMRNLTLDSTLWVEDVDDQPVPMNGWIRGHHRTSTLDVAPERLRERATLPTLEYQDEQYPLAPFVRFDGNSCLTWNSGDEKKAEYIDYSTGKITKLPVEPVFDEEGPAQRHTLGGASPKPTRHFTDREGFTETFEDALANFDPEKHRVVTYFGVSGIGKSRLRKKLQSMLDERDAPVTWATLNFETSEHRTAADALYWMRNELRRKGGIQFTSFDLAYAIYWQKTHPQSDVQKDGVPFLNKGSHVAELFGLAEDLLDEDLLDEDLLFMQIGAKLPELVQKASTSVQEWWNRCDQGLLSYVHHIGPAGIAEWLPTLWANDLKNHIENSGQRIVLFIDTYEALWEGRRTESRFFTADDWVREWVAHLPEVLWVITGRERLRWEEGHEDWSEVLDQHLMGELADADAQHFLESCGIRDENTQKSIIVDSEGVPFYLNLAVDAHEKGDQTEKRYLNLDDGALGEGVGRFLHSLSIEERQTLKVLAVARQWDRELSAALIERFQTGYSATALAQLCRFSFVQETDTPDTWTLHALMREALQERQDAVLLGEVHRFLFDYYAESLQNPDLKKLRNSHQTALRETLHHGPFVLDLEDYQDWFNNAIDPFKEAAQYHFLVPLREELFTLIEDHYGPKHMFTATSMHNLAGLYHLQGRDAEAEPLFQRALKIKQEALGKEHPDVAIILSDLANLYDLHSHYGEAEPLYQRILEIEEKNLGEKHPDVAATLNKIAGLYDSQGRHEEAEPLYRRALKIDKEAFGEKHLSVATTLDNLAGMYDSQSRHEEAKPLYQRALNIKEKALGEKHPSVATTLNNLAGLYDSQGRYDEAESLYGRALEIVEATLGKHHSSTMFIRKNLQVLRKGRTDTNDSN